MSNTSNLYTDSANLYGVTISSDGNTLQYTDPTEGPQTIPSIVGNAGEFLQVNAAADNIEWTSFTSGGGLPVNKVILNQGTVNDPSLTFSGDTNSGVFSGGADDVAVSTGGVQRLDVSNTAVTVGTVANPLNLVVNGTINSTATTVATGASWNNLALDSLVLNTASADFTLTLNGTGTASIGRKIRFYKSNTNNNIIFTAADGVSIRLTGPFGTQLQTNASYTHVPSSSTFTWLFEITRTEATNYQLTTLSLTNGTNSFIQGNVFRAGDGLLGTPSFSFSNTNGTDTGMFYSQTAGDDCINFSTDNYLVMQFRDNFRTQTYRPFDINHSSSATSPALMMGADTTTGLYKPTTNQLAITTNGVQNTNFTASGVDIGQTNLNNTNLKTLTQNGASNFNTFTPAYASILLPQTAIGTINQALSGCDFDGSNYVVSVAGVGTGARLFVSSNLTTWTTISDTQISLGNAQVQYGNGIWCYLSRTNNAQQLWTSTAPATTWTQIGSGVPWTTARQANRLKFINGQFIVLMSGSIIRFSSNGTTWTEYTANATSYTLNDITYSPELQRYVIVTGGAAILYFSGNTITNTSAFTAVTTNAETANCCSYSPKYGLFLYHGNTNSQRYYISKDGINWTFYTNPTTVTNSNNTIWINDFGGFFLDMQFNQSQVAVSRDGLSFQTIASNLTMTTVNCVYNATGKVLLIVGSSGAWGTFRNMLTDFNAYVDADAVYNTFNSNIRFADVIEYQGQNITPVSGNNHFTPQQFTRPVINFDTTSANANIYLSGTSFAGRVGSRFRIRKFASSTNGVRLHGFETCRLLCPLANVTSFNAQSSPQVYTMIPTGYFGSFDLSRVSDDGNGVWVVDNLMCYDANGTEVKLNNLVTQGGFSATGRVENLRLTDGIFEGTLSTNVFTTSLFTPYNLSVRRNQGLVTDIKQIEFTDLGVDGLGFVFYMFGEQDHLTNVWQIKNSSGQDLWVYTSTYTALANGSVLNIAGGGAADYHTYMCNYRTTVNGVRRWIIRTLSSN